MASARERSLALSAMLAVLACDRADDESNAGDSTGDPVETSDTTSVGVGSDESSSSGTGDAPGDSGSSGGEVPSFVPGRECPPDSFLDSINFGMPFVTTWCTGCHASDLVGDAERQMAPAGLDFDSLETIRAQLLLVYMDAADEHDEMPPAGGPSPEERSLLGEWLACGAP